jgi:hypothetical protein
MEKGRVIRPQPVWHAALLAKMSLKKTSYSSLSTMLMKEKDLRGYKVPGARFWGLEAEAGITNFKSLNN